MVKPDIYTRYQICRVGRIVCLVVIIIGLRNILMTRSADGIAGVGFLFGGAALGMAFAVAFIYYRQQLNDPKTQQQVAVETLAKIGRQRSKNDKSL